MSEGSISPTVMLPLLRTLLLGSADTLTSPGGLIPGHFRKYSENQPSPRSMTVYTISGAYESESEVVYDWEHLRPLSTSSGKTVYSVADDRVHPARRCIADELIESGALDSLGVGTEVIIPVDPENLYPGLLRVRSAIFLLPGDASPGEFKVF